MVTVIVKIRKKKTLSIFKKKTFTMCDGYMFECRYVI